MNIKPVASKHEIGATIKTSNSSDARSRAIAALSNQAQPKQQDNTPDLSALMGNQATQQVVGNQNSISPEEMSAVNPIADEKATETVEVTKPKEEPKQEDPALSRQFAQLARQEKALRAKQAQQDQAVRAREAELKAREDALNAKDQQYKSGYISKDTLKKNPLLALQEAGISYDDVTNQILNQGTTDPRVEATINQLMAKIESLENANKSRDQWQQDEQKNQYETAKKQLLVDTRSLVQNDPDFETIKATGSYNDVVDLIEQVYKKDGILLTVEEAAKEVEDYLVDEAIKITNINKIKSRLASAQAPKTQSTEQKPQPVQQTQMKTLTNASSASRPLTARERALAAFKGQKIS